MKTGKFILVLAWWGPLAGPAGVGSLVAASIVTSAEAAMSSKLGDLSSFRTIVTHTTALVDKADLAGAKTRIKDLETSWPEAEPGLKPSAPAERHKVDTAITPALKPFRATA